MQVESTISKLQAQQQALRLNSLQISLNRLHNTMSRIVSMRYLNIGRLWMGELKTIIIMDRVARRWMKRRILSRAIQGWVQIHRMEKIDKRRELKEKEIEGENEQWGLALEFSEFALKNKAIEGWRQVCMETRKTREMHGLPPRKGRPPLPPKDPKSKTEAAVGSFKERLREKKHELYVQADEEIRRQREIVKEEEAARQKQLLATKRQELYQREFGEMQEHKMENEEGNVEDNNEIMANPSNLTDNPEPQMLQTMPHDMHGDHTKNEQEDKSTRVKLSQTLPSAVNAVPSDKPPVSRKAASPLGGKGGQGRSSSGRVSREGSLSSSQQRPVSIQSQQSFDERQKERRDRLHRLQIQREEEKKAERARAEENRLKILAEEERIQREEALRKRRERMEIEKKRERDRIQSMREEEIDNSIQVYYRQKRAERIFRLWAGIVQTNRVKGIQGRDRLDRNIKGRVLKVIMDEMRDRFKDKARVRWEREENITLWRNKYIKRKCMDVLKDMVTESRRLEERIIEEGYELRRRIIWRFWQRIRGALRDERFEKQRKDKFIVQKFLYRRLGRKVFDGWNDVIRVEKKERMINKDKTTYLNKVNEWLKELEQKK